MWHGLGDIWVRDRHVNCEVHGMTDDERVFPVSQWVHPKDGKPFIVVAGGLSVRDWFAGQALSGLMGNSNLTQSLKGYPQPYNLTDVTHIRLLAASARRMGDAMMESRGNNVS